MTKPNKKINADNQELRPKKQASPLLVAGYLGVTDTSNVS